MHYLEALNKKPQIVRPKAPDPLNNTSKQNQHVGGSRSRASRTFSSLAVAPPIQREEITDTGLSRRRSSGGDGGEHIEPSTSSVQAEKSQKRQQRQQRSIVPRPPPTSSATAHQQHSSKNFHHTRQAHADKDIQKRKKKKKDREPSAAVNRSQRGTTAQRGHNRRTNGALTASSHGVKKHNVINKHVRFRTGFTNTVLDVMTNLGWERVPADSDQWDFFWCEAQWVRESQSSMFKNPAQRVCHYPNHYELTRKDCGITNMKRLKKSLEKTFGKGVDTGCDFYPPTFKLPGEYHMFVEVFKQRKDSVWIMKPVASAQGKGIFLFSKLSEIIEWKKDTRYQPSKEGEQKADLYIVQNYIPNPFLVGGKKFDLRIYVLVTSYKPLQVWLYREGFARFSNSLFSMNKKDIANNFIHLTNVAIQKTAAGYDKSKGCKWSVSRLKAYLLTRYEEEKVSKCFLDINTVIIRSLQSVQPVMTNDSHCFEVYGYDILIDDKLKPWLIEVNASPSLTADTPEDYKLKTGMLEDLFTIVDIQRRGLGKELQRVGGFDLLWHDGDVAMQSQERLLGASMIQKSTLGTYMGDRSEHRKLVVQEVFSE